MAFTSALLLVSSTRFPYSPFVLLPHVPLYCLGLALALLFLALLFSWPAFPLPCFTFPCLLHITLHILSMATPI